MKVKHKVYRKGGGSICMISSAVLADGGLHEVFRSRMPITNGHVTMRSFRMQAKAARHALELTQGRMWEAAR